jgi:hypothetical protein
MVPDKAPVIPLHLHPGFQDWRRVTVLKSSLLTETLAYVQVALDNAESSRATSSRAVRILERARALLDEAREQLVDEVYSG